MANPKTEVRVECYAGYRADETPRRFHLGEKTLEVIDVLDRWLSPEHRYFKCRASDGGRYLLRHDVARDRWELTFYQRGQRDPLGAPTAGVGRRKGRRQP